MKRNASGLVDLLIGMVVLAAICMMSASFMNNSSLNVFGNGSSSKSVKEHVDTTVNEIEQMRQQSIEMQTRAIQQQFE